MAGRQLRPAQVFVNLDQLGLHVFCNKPNHVLSRYSARYSPSVSCVPACVPAPCVPDEPWFCRLQLGHGLYSFGHIADMVRTSFYWLLLGYFWLLRWKPALAQPRPRTRPKLETCVETMRVENGFFPQCFAHDFSRV